MENVSPVTNPPSTPNETVKTVKPIEPPLKSAPEIPEIKEEKKVAEVPLAPVASTSIASAVMEPMKNMVSFIKETATEVADVITESIEEAKVEMVKADAAEVTVSHLSEEEQEKAFRDQFKILYIRDRHRRPFGCIVWRHLKGKNMVEYQYSICHVNDTFNRTLAKHIAFQRLLKASHVVAVADTEPFHEVYKAIYRGILDNISKIAYSYTYSLVENCLVAGPTLKKRKIAKGNYVVPIPPASEVKMATAKEVNQILT
jgi:hypothetical protein